MNGHWIDIPTAGATGFSGYLSLPPAGKGPGIVMLQEIWGVNSHIRTVADQYALAGYVVLAPDVFWRMSPRLDLNYDDEGNAQAFSFYQKMDTAQAAKDVADAVATLRTLPELNGKVATLGFCFGGQLAYRAAALSHADAAVCFYGGGIEQHLDIADQITQPILFHYAAQDSHISQDKVAAVKAAFSGKDNATFRDYPNTDHGFNCWGRPAMYNQRAAALAEGRTLTFLAENL
ncbi:dienelactone hydrolase family protein [Glaciimonas immobilis]|uniref:Carboxymethylenebutenolidase n=1 Tax=Glaciimonas immobilis TaxID=728004 RepID=A0A840RKL6_9BURK|nr:dienelactone hydrolase family protein [Glaciimonas immobilis]KAF3998919.1 dienelactone hydrolase family protein [Glaciimonas immobilis]MBB5198323.1 carboxymethylenebutenolidase [Glaciimonas immobilis]